MSNTNTLGPAGVLAPKGRIVGHVSGIGHLIGECKIGNVPSGQFITKDDIPEHGSLVQCIDGKLVIEDLIPAETQEY